MIQWLQPNAPDARRDLDLPLGARVVLVSVTRRLFIPRLVHSLQNPKSPFSPSPARALENDRESNKDLPEPIVATQARVTLPFNDLQCRIPFDTVSVLHIWNAYVEGPLSMSAS